MNLKLTSKQSLYDYLAEAYSVEKLKSKVACCNCGSRENLIADPDADDFVCEYCARHSVYDAGEREVIWCDARKGNKK